jgi:hypothetical protein
MMDTPAAFDWGVLARVIHIVAVIVWVGAIWVVTTDFLPRLRQRRSDEWFHEFSESQSRLLRQVRVAMVLVLLSGFYMLHRYTMWGRFADPGYWWMHLMVGVWLLFAVMLFIVEPLAMHSVIARRVILAPSATLRLLLGSHRVALALYLLVIVSAVAGSHGLF